MTGRPVMIIGTTSRKRLQAEHDHDDHDHNGDHPQWSGEEVWLSDADR